MILAEFSHNQALTALDSKILSDLKRELTKVNTHYSKAKNLREGIILSLSKLGWSSKIKLDTDTNISITSFNHEHGLCLQTGNMSRFYADLLKLEYLYQKKKIKAAIFLIPSKEVAKILGSNIAHFERLTKELKLFSGIIKIPILVIGLKY